MDNYANLLILVNATSIRDGHAINSSIVMTMSATNINVRNEDVRQPWSGHLQDSEVVNVTNPHTQRPVDRHHKCIGRVDLGNSITNQVMDRIKRF